MQRSMTFLGLVASVGLLLAVFAFALKNPELFIDDVRITYADSTVSSSDKSPLVGAKISGEVVDSQEVQVRESAKIQEAELDALQKEQWLQQVDPKLAEYADIGDELDFAPELPTGKVKPLNNSADSDVNDVNTQDIVQDGVAAKESAPSIKQALKELKDMTFADIRFQFGQLTLSDKAIQKIEAVASVLKKNPSINAKINNYTDSYGDDAFNLELSRQRANMVYQAFLDRGVNKQQLSFEGLGESNPVTSNATLAGRKKNRRTEILFFEAK